MKFTGRTLYCSGTAQATDIATDDAPSRNTGLIPIFSNEQRNIGFVVRKFTAFPNASTTDGGIERMILTSYTQRDCRALREGGAAGGNQVLRILGISPGISPAANDRVLATYAMGDINLGGVIKRDALFVQELSIGVDQPRGSITYYVEFDEYELSDDEMVLALLGESDMNTANFIVADA